MFRLVSSRLALICFSFLSLSYVVVLSLPKGLVVCVCVCACVCAIVICKYHEKRKNRSRRNICRLSISLDIPQEQGLRHQGQAFPRASETNTKVSKGSRELSTGWFSEHPNSQMITEQ